MRTFTAVVLGLAAYGATGPVRHAVRHAEPAVGQQTADFTWHGKVAPGKTVAIRGINGDVEATAASGDEVEVTAVKRGRHSDPADVRIEVVPHDGNVTICAVYPGDDNTCEPGGGHQETHNNDVSVRFTVRVPAGVAFDGHTVNGEVTASGLSGNVGAHTVNGSVDVATSGWVEASTVNGSVTAQMGRADWTGDLRFSTVNGNITLTLPSALDTELRGQTVNGGIESDFPVTVQGRFGPRRFTGVIGQGGRTLELKTVNGSLRLKKA